MPDKIFIHGLESSNKGTKAVFFKQRYPDMIIPNFPGSLEQRMKKLCEILSNESGIRLVGSSFGGLMASLFAMENEPKVDKLILLAPAINLMDLTKCVKKQISVPVRIYHGKDDEVIPLKEVKKVAEGLFRNLSFHTVDDDHMLHRTFKTIDWDGLLNE